MKKLITYDPEIQMAYLYVIPFTSEIEIETTEELEENPKLNVDIDQFDRIVGIEFFGENADKLKELTNRSKIYKKKTSNDNSYIYSFRVSQDNYLQKVLFQNVVFYFADKNYEEFIGFDIIKPSLYGYEILDFLSEC
ncbi:MULTISPECIES: DUF2283 domain-containing protein [Bacillus cereus group]|uniref:DUF2283 domain-containing protein n=1 Tax=Bacillus wiedmannii TaxID=1890302 RepID=A0ABD6TNU4_9BACI|nr:MULTISPECIES: DUF2283 domain-containing protein [Bacillus cereus group]KAA0787930.1 DUF2283 domain-containing protein [Bacillus sp. BB081]PEA78593.1 hypothetical protein CON92_07840 [Bacillus wiedmannii]PEG07078.1 hypothetical protein CON96_27400 [Bacillus wiedmannii]PEJ48165.1 hypothetical protein CN676_21760 [Bacillus wiedmannii]PEN44474.1 hypothetical protein CN630_22260 [Bacillus wiedmannii]